MKKMILVDLETQKLDVKSGIYEVSCLVIDNYEIVDTLYLGNKIQGYKGPTTYGNGFRDISKDTEYIKKFKDFLLKHNNLPLVAHNCSFDRKFLLHYNWIDEDYHCCCSIQAIKNEVPGLPSYSLANLIEHFNISKKNNHTANSDTESLLELLKVVKPKYWKKMAKPKEKSTNNSKNNGYYHEVKIRKTADEYTPEEREKIGKSIFIKFVIVVIVIILINVLK